MNVEKPFGKYRTSEIVGVHEASLMGAGITQVSKRTQSFTQDPMPSLWLGLSESRILKITLRPR